MAEQGLLFVIEGLDGCGKSTQLPLVSDALRARGLQNRAISYPDYESESSALVRLYLSGAFGDAATDVNPYAASGFYAVDRYASYKQFWQHDFENGVSILAGRYVSSNAIYQMTKLPREAWDDFLTWLADHEYNKLGLPRPDAVVFLDMPLALSQKLLLQRYEGHDDRKDIHERDLDFLAKCREAALYAAQKEGWHILPCADENGLLPKEVMTWRITELLHSLWK